jgi:GNAT superfamily N-acetyltransferase
MPSIIDLKKDRSFIGQYVDLRNRYVDLLLTDPVTVDGTYEWLSGKNIEIRCLVENGTLLGAVILYLDKRGEVAFFTKDQGKGIGSKLLSIIEGVARENNMKSIWAWVLSSNRVAQKTFLKNGYLSEGKSDRRYIGKVRQGVLFRKSMA